MLSVRFEGGAGRRLLVLAPVYVAVLLVLKGMKSLVGLVQPFTHLLPAWVPAEEALFRSPRPRDLLPGRRHRGLTGGTGNSQMGEGAVFERIPGYSLIRSLTQQVAGESLEKAWKAALFQSDEALLPAFIIEELDDGPTARSSTT